MFVEKLKGPEPAISCEFFPPKTDAGWETLARTMRDLRDEKLDFVSVTYGAGGSVRHLTADLVERMVGEYGLPAMAHLTCVENDADALNGGMRRGIGHADGQARRSSNMLVQSAQQRTTARQD